MKHPPVSLPHSHPSPHHHTPSDNGFGTFYRSGECTLKTQTLAADGLPTWYARVSPSACACEVCTRACMAFNLLCSSIQRCCFPGMQGPNIPWTGGYLAAAA